MNIQNPYDRDEQHLIQLMERTSEQAPDVPATADLQRGKKKLRTRQWGAGLVGLGTAAAVAGVVALGVTTIGSADSPNTDAPVASSEEPLRKSIARAGAGILEIDQHVREVAIAHLDPGAEHLVGNSTESGIREGTKGIGKQGEDTQSINLSMLWQSGERAGDVKAGLASPYDAKYGPDTRENPDYYRCAWYDNGDYDTCERERIAGKDVWVMRDEVEGLPRFSVAYEWPDGSVSYALYNRRTTSASPAEGEFPPLSSDPVTLADLVDLVTDPSLEQPVL